MNAAARTAIAVRSLSSPNGSRTSRPRRFHATRAVPSTSVAARSGIFCPDHAVERIVGRPSSAYMGLGWPAGSAVADVTSLLRRASGSNRSLLETAKKLWLYNCPNDLQPWSRVVLLVSEAAGHPNVDSSAEENESGVLRGQRTLAEVVEMIRTSHLIHNGLLNVCPGPKRIGLDDNVHFDNKVALLSGDCLLAHSLCVLCTLKNPDLMELIWSGLRDLTEVMFVGRRDAQHNPLPSPFQPFDPQLGPSRFRFDPFQPFGPPGSGPSTPARRDWTRRNVLSAGSLLGKLCQGTLLLAGHDERLQKQGFLFGKHLSLAWQAYLELKPFQSRSSYSMGICFKLHSAPVMFHLEHDSSLFEEIDKGVNSIQDVDYVKIHDIVMNGPGIDHTKQLRKEHSQKALEILDIFEENDARTALSNMIVAMDRE